MNRLLVAALLVLAVVAYDVEESGKFGDFLKKAGQKVAPHVKDIAREVAPVLKEAVTNKIKNEIGKRIKLEETEESVMYPPRYWMDHYRPTNPWNRSRPQVWRPNKTRPNPYYYRDSISLKPAFNFLEGFGAPRDAIKERREGRGFGGGIRNPKDDRPRPTKPRDVKPPRSDNQIPWKKRPTLPKIAYFLEIEESQMMDPRQGNRFNSTGKYRPRDQRKPKGDKNSNKHNQQGGWGRWLPEWLKPRKGDKTKDGKPGKPNKPGKPMKPRWDINKPKHEKTEEQKLW